MRKHSGGTVSDLKIHLVLVTKYRYNVITGNVLKRLEEILVVFYTCVKDERMEQFLTTCGYGTGTDLLSKLQQYKCRKKWEKR
jgi:hypothetical protein